MNLLLLLLLLLLPLQSRFGSFKSYHTLCMIKVLMAVTQDYPLQECNAVVSGRNCQRLGWRSGLFSLLCPEDGGSTVIYFLIAFAKLRKETAGFFMSVSLSGWNNSAATGRIFHEIWYLSIFRKYRGHAVAQFVEALPYKPEGRGFDSRCCHWNFSLA
jgi:hypothetical protein